MQNLKEKTLSGLFWNMSERVGLRLVQFLPTILLARLLSPDEFGLMGMLVIFTLLAEVFLDSGFGAALIQKKDADFTDECSIFYFNIFVGMVIVALLFLAAPWIAAFYNQPALIAMTRWLSLDILLKSFTLIQTTLLTRQLDFKTQIKANLSATLLGGAAGVAAAYAGWGAWSLVAQTLASSAIRAVAMWRMSAWRPALVFSLASLKSMFTFGSNMLFSSLLATFFDNFYQVFIGKYFSAASLGYYTRANSLKRIVMDTTSDTLGRVLYPALSSVQNDVERLRRAYRKTILLSVFVHFPLMFGLAVVAKPLITLLFSEKWAESILFFQLMCAAGLLYPLQVINLQILKVKGRSDLYFNLALIKRGLLLVTILITFRWGIAAMLVGQVVNSVIAYGINCYYSDRLIAYPISAQLADIFPTLLFSALMAGGIWFLESFLQTPDWLTLLIQSAAGVGIFLTLNLLARSESLREAAALGKRYLAPGASGA